jgi:cystathionine beta-lyase family protein involved in aluminum resistance
MTASDVLAKAYLESREEVLPVWAKIDETVMANHERVLDSFISERVALHHMSGTTGYGYGDAGRDTLDRLYARVFGAQDGLVRPHWASGTHALKTALFALLRPGDDVLAVTGPSYDTLAPVTREGGLKGFGITYRETDCLSLYEEGRIDMDAVEADLSSKIRSETRVLYIQRSRGYSARKSISVSSLLEFMGLVKRRWPGLWTMVDNCYCEFTGQVEPPMLGVSLTVGSLIKNPGGGLAPTGAYAVGESEAVARVAESLYAPGLGSEAGSWAAGYRDLYQGFFLAPKVVGECLKGIAFAASFLGRLGFKVDPGPLEERSDIVQAVTLGSPEKLKAFAAAIQASSPVDSFATPEPWDMPGYGRQIIMAAGTFVQGSSIELSCDAPFTEPYTAYLQGGLTKEHVMLAVRRAASKVLGV